ncbi:Purple acid phosphatase 18 [Chlorella vulgaris]
MDALVSAAVEQVALCPDGCPLMQLWGALGGAAEEAGVQLTAPVRSAFGGRLSAEDEELRSLAAAEAAGVLLSAERDLQSVAVGLYDSQLTRFNMSDTQRKALSLIGAAGRRGALQSDLAQAVGSENRNFFYVVKLLEQRGLVVKHPLAVKRQGVTSSNAAHVTTNLLHLTRFAPPNVPQGTRMTDGKSTAHGAGPGQIALGEAEMAVLDDTTHFTRVCARLAACAGQQADETQLKAVLGFRAQQGHRMWRRIKAALVKQGHLEEFLARTADEKAVKCIKLIKPWTGEQSEPEADEEGEGAGEGALSLSTQVAERTIDRQLLRQVVTAGSEGVTTGDVDAALRLNMKRNEMRMKELETRFGITKHAMNQGRVLTSRYIAPEALLDQLRDTFAPLAPPTGWLGAVVEAIQAGLDEGEEFPWPQLQQQQQGQQQQQQQGQQQEQQQQQQQQQQPEQQQQQAVVVDALLPHAAHCDAFLAAVQRGAEDASQPMDAPLASLVQPAATAAAIIPAAAPSGQPGQLQQPRQPPLMLSEALSLQTTSGAAARAFPFGQDQGPVTQTARRFTLGAQQRSDWLAEAIAARGFVLASELPRYFKERAEGAGLAKATLPDRKTCDRIVQRGQEQGLWQVLSIHFPASAFSSLQKRTHTVIAAPGTAADSAFADAVYQEYTAYKRRAHGSGNIAEQAEQAEQRGKELPVVQLQKLVRTAKRGKARRPGTATAGAGATSSEELSSGDEALPIIPAQVDGFRLIQANGYQTLRAPRLIVVHSVACRLAGLPSYETQQQQQQQPAGGHSGTAAPAAAAAAAAPQEAVPARVFVMSFGPGTTTKRDVQQVDLGQDFDMARRVLTSQAIWDALTVPQFLHVAGSMSPDPQAVRRLASSGRTLGQLSAAELAELCGGVEECARAKARLMQLLEMSHRMGLLSSVMPLGPSASSLFASGLSSSPSAMYAVARQLHIQEPQEEHEATAAAGGNGSGSAPLNVTFDLTVPGAGGAYWDHLQYVVARHGTFRAASSSHDPLGRCFPFELTPEVSFDRAFAHRKEVTQEQIALLDAFLQGEDAQSLSSKRCRQVADQLAMPLQAVLAFVAEHKRPTQRLGRLVTERMQRLGSARGGSFGVLSPVERRKAQQRENYAKARLQKLQAQYPSGVPPEKVPVQPRKRSNQPRKPPAKAAGKRKAAGRGEGEVESDADALLPEEEASDGDKAALMDRSALLPVVEQAVPSRKKRWYRYEDRELLTSWAMFAAINGSSKVLLWRKLNELQKVEELGGKVAEIRALALRLHALKLQATAAPEHSADASERSEQEGEEGQGQGAGSKRVSAQQLVEAPPGKRARTEPEAAAASAGSPPEASGGGRGDGAGSAVVQPAMAALQALLPGGWTRGMAAAAKQEVAEALTRLADLTDQVVAAAPKQHKEVVGQEAGPAAAAKSRRPGPQPLSAAAVKQLHASRTTHVAARPTTLLKRWAAALKGAGSFLPARGGEGAEGAEAAATVGDREAAGTRPGPSVTAALALAESLLFLGSQTGILGTGYETALSSRFAAADILRAFELLRRQGALLSGGAQAGSQPHLSSRWRAQLRYVRYPTSIFQEAASAAAAFQRNPRLDVAAAALVPPPPAAAAAAGDAGQQQQPADQLTGGWVAEVLGRMAAGRLLLRPHKVRANPRLSAAALAAVARDDGASSEGAGQLLRQQQHTAPLDLKVSLRAVATAEQGGGGGSEGSAAGGGGGASHAAQAGHPGSFGAGLGAAGAGAGVEGEGEAEGMADGGGGEEAAPVGNVGLAGGRLAQQLKYTRQELVLYQPSLVAASTDARQAAEAACRAAALHAGVAGSAFDAALASLRAAGAEGLTQPALAAALQHASGGAGVATSGGNSSGSSGGGRAEDADSPQQVADLLLLHGLARSVCCFDGTSLAAVEHSQHLLSFPFLARPADQAKQPASGSKQKQHQQETQQQQQQQQQEAWRSSFAAEVQRLAAALCLPAGGHLQPSLDVPVRPWVDHHGRLNTQLWSSLVKKALAAAARQPGLPQDAFLNELSVLAPQHARELLHILEAGRLLKVATAAAPPAASVLAACFAPVGSDGGSTGDSIQQRFFFVAPTACFSAAEVLPPQALLPLTAEHCTPATLGSHGRPAQGPTTQNMWGNAWVHLSFAGPGAYAVTWVTHPLDDDSLAAADVSAAAGAAAVAETHTSAAGDEPYLASAGPQPHLVAQHRQAAADAAGLEAGSLEGADAVDATAAKHKHKHKHKHRKRRRSCVDVENAGTRSVVQYGIKEGDYTFTVESPEPVACYASGAYLSGAIHRAYFGAGLEGPLPHNTTIFYRVGDPDRSWSKEFSFRTAPLVGAASLPYRLGLIGDLGQSDHSLSTLDHVEVTQPASIILTGDLSYADGYQPRWDAWGRMVAPFTSRQPWHYCVGNHEIELTDGREDFLSYLTRFHFPYRSCGSESKLYYSYEEAGAHIVMLGSYVAYDRASPQYAWLLRDLAAVDRARTPWVVVVQHAPWYNSNYAHQGEGDAMKESMEQLLYQYGVDFVFSGHVHAYERHHPVFRGELDDCAPVHINIGDGGNKEGPDSKYYPQPKYSAFREPSYGHGTLDLVDETHAEWRWHRNQDDGPDTADYVNVVRDPACKTKRGATLAALQLQLEQGAAAGKLPEAPQQQAQQGRARGGGWARWLWRWGLSG